MRAAASKGGPGQGAVRRDGGAATLNGRRKDGPKKRLAQIEREIGSSETRLSELTAVLANPTQHRGINLGDVSREYDSLSHRLQELYGEWEGLAVE